MKSLLSVFCVLLISTPALAARAGTVDVEGAELHQFADRASVVLIKLHKGTRLVASNVETLGFHKVRLRTSLVGWVFAKSLVLQPVLPAAVTIPGNDTAKEVPPAGDLQDIPPPSAPLVSTPAAAPVTAPDAAPAAPPDVAP
jgi:hypothetical protein